jgi:site-specific DNA-methyltransferase (adenine-specific)
MGSGTTAIAARRCGRQFVGFELNPEYCAIIAARLSSAEAELQILNNQPTEPVRAKPVPVKASKRISKAKTTTVAVKAKAKGVKPAVRKKSTVALET